MTLVPKHGYAIQPVWISGLYRQLTLKNILRNLSLPLKYIYSQVQAKKIIQSFKPDLVIGTGGYASFPIGRQAARLNIPLFLQEQNAIPGLVNKQLAVYAQKIFLGNEAAQSFFPSEKIIFSGNPTRPHLTQGDKIGLAQKLNWDIQKPTVLITGGSLGAKTLNEAVSHAYAHWLQQGIQVIWQCGKFYEEALKQKIKPQTGLYLSAFLENMPDFYALADLVVCRAGAMTLAELIVTQKPAILVPSPNVADDHQTKNAHSLTQKEAALFLADSACIENLIHWVPQTLQNELIKLQKNISAVQVPHFEEIIKKEIQSL